MLKENQWYQIKCVAPSPIGYKGKALLVAKRVPNYASNVSAFICADGGAGYFSTDEIGRRVAAPKNLKSILFKLGKQSV